MSTLNRSLCAALASAGHEVLCLVPQFVEEEREDAARQGIALVAAPRAIGLSDEARLCLPLDIEDPDVVIGHGHVTGPVAAARAALVPGASRIHVLHTAPEELEWLKTRGKDPAARSAEKQELEAALAASATVALAVGPRLARQWQTFFAGAAPHVALTRLDPGLPSFPAVAHPAPGLVCLLLGRAEDYEIKGLDIAAAALGRLRRNDPYFEGAREPVLVIRGAAPGSAEDLRRRLHAAAGIGLRVNIKEYTHDESSVREDLARASVLLLPSRAEGFGLVGLEALAMGVPVLVSTRSGIAELLVDRAEENPDESFLRSLVVDIKDDIATDAAAWADALGETLRNRVTAFEQAAKLRSLLLDAKYWENSVHAIIARLPFAERPPAGTEIDQASWWAERDPIVAVGVASAILESELSRLAALRGPSDLSPRLALQMIGAHDLLSPTDSQTASRLIHYRNHIVHGVEGTAISENEARDHVRDVSAVTERIRERVAAHETVCASIASAQHPDEWMDVLVWIAEPRLRTCWITRSNHSFSLQGERQGILLSGGQRIWMWEDGLVPIALTNQNDVSRMYEEHLDIENRPKVAGRVNFVRLVDIESGVVAHVGGERTGGDAKYVTMLACRVTPTFSVGNFLFAEERTDSLALGAAHPMYGASLKCVDLRTGEHRDAWCDKSEGTRFRDLFAAESLAHLTAGYVQDGLGEPISDDLVVTTYRPSYSEDGRLRASFQMTAPVPYAFSDGAWGAYTRSTTVTSDALPVRLQAFATLPHAVRWLFGTQFPSRFGWTAIEPDRRQDLLKAFVSGTAIRGLVDYPLGT